jgi:hypothetical protein
MVLLDILYSYYYENICLSQNFYFDLYLSFDTLIPYISAHNCNIHVSVVFFATLFHKQFHMHLVAMQHLNQLLTPL